MTLDGWNLGPEPTDPVTRLNIERLFTDGRGATLISSSPRAFKAVIRLRESGKYPTDLINEGCQEELTCIGWRLKRCT